MLKIIFFSFLILVSPACLAAQFTFADSHITFHVPDTWSRIMTSKGYNESMVFQVPKPATSDEKTLTRVTISSEPSASLFKFKQLIAAHIARAQELPGFSMDKQHTTPSQLIYITRDNHVAEKHVERFYFLDDYTLIVHCTRPAHHAEKNNWTKQFDHQCRQIEPLSQ